MKKKNKKATTNLEPHLLRSKQEIVHHKQAIDRILWKVKRNPIALLRMVFRHLPATPVEKCYIALQRESLETLALNDPNWADPCLSNLREELGRLKAFVEGNSPFDPDSWECFSSDNDTDDDEEYPFGSQPEESESFYSDEEDDVFPMGDYESDDNNMKSTLGVLNDVLCRLQSLLVDVERISEE